MQRCVPVLLLGVGVGPRCGRRFTRIHDLAWWHLTLNSHESCCCSCAPIPLVWLLKHQIEQCVGPQQAAFDSGRITFSFLYVPSVLTLERYASTRSSGFNQSTAVMKRRHAAIPHHPVLSSPTPYFYRHHYVSGGRNTKSSRRSPLDPLARGSEAPAAGNGEITGAAQMPPELMRICLSVDLVLRACCSTRSPKAFPQCRSPSSWRSTT